MSTTARKTSAEVKRSAKLPIRALEAYATWVRRICGGELKPYAHFDPGAADYQQGPNNCTAFYLYCYTKQARHNIESLERAVPCDKRTLRTRQSGNTLTSSPARRDNAPASKTVQDPTNRRVSNKEAQNSKSRVLVHYRSKLILRKTTVSG